MRRGRVAFLGLTLVAIGLASCGRFQREQRAAWRDEAEAACMSRGDVRPSAYMSFRDQPIQGPGTCGMNRPVRVNAFLGGQIAVSSTQTLACPIVPVTDRFLEQVVQPAAMGVLGTQVIEMRAGSYSCRAMNNGTGTTRRSEHAFGNALDIFSFRTSDGREITVRHGWNGSPEEQAFLREVFVGACELYSTVLGPGADMFHYDHLHVDLARHAGGRKICRPVIKYTPRRDLPPPDPARNWASLEQRRATASSLPPLATSPRLPAQREEPPPSATSGPIRLPGSVMSSEELVVGDIEGEMIDPDNDPFALEDPRNPRAPATPRAPQPPVAADGMRWQTGPSALPAPPHGARPVAPGQAAGPSREWPPRF